MTEKLYRNIEKHITSQIKFWSEQNKDLDSRGLKSAAPSRSTERDVVLPFVTVSREYGCGGYEVAERLATLLNEDYYKRDLWVAYDRKVLETIMKDMGLSHQLAETMTLTARKTMTNFFQTTFSKFPPQVAVYKKLTETVMTIASNGYGIIVGRAGNAITRDMECGFHVRLVASMEWKINRISELMNLKKKDAEALILEKSRQRDEFLREFVRFDNSDVLNYHLVINNARYNSEEAAAIIAKGMLSKGLVKTK